MVDDDSVTSKVLSTMKMLVNGRFEGQKNVYSERGKDLKPAVKETTNKRKLHEDRT